MGNYKGTASYEHTQWEAHTKAQQLQIASLKPVKAQAIPHPSMTIGVGIELQVQSIDLLAASSCLEWERAFLLQVYLTLSAVFS